MTYIWRWRWYGGILNGMAEEWITTDEAAEIVGVTTHQIRHLLRDGTIVGKKFARSWMVERRSAEEYARQDRKPGPKSKDY